MRWLQRVPLCGPAIVPATALVATLAACARLPEPEPGARPSPAPATRPPEGAAPRQTSGEINPPDAAPRAASDNATAPGVRLASDGRPIAPRASGAPLAIPEVDGPLAVKVVYPRPGQVIGAADSTFIFGSVGSGRATLTINGINVPVNPNGAFLAWLPFPPGERPTYELVATKTASGATGGGSAEGAMADGRTTAVRATLEVARPPVMKPLPETGRLVVDRASLRPDSGLRLRGDEPVRVAIRTQADARVTLRLADGSTRQLEASGQSFRLDLPARLLARPARLTVARRGESVVLAVPAVDVVDPDAPRFVALRNSNLEARSDTDAVAILRPTPGGTYKWFLFPGTVLEATATRGAWTRVRLDDALEAWVETRDVERADRTARPRRIASNARVVGGGPGSRWTDVRIPVGERPAFSVAESADAITLTLYDVVSDVDIINFPTNDPTIRDVTWQQVASDRVQVTAHLRHAPYGYLALWDRGAFVLRVRRPPDVDPARPLAGRVIAVDAGHPPIGSTGPTGLYEGDAVLAVAEALKPMLEREGATVVMTRTTPAAVPLGARPIVARRADADVLVSIHLNAHPDGVNPYRTNGTGTYYFHDHAAALARDVQRGLVKWMGLRDLGVNYDNLALARPTWMPAILCEGAFVILPDQEAALRTPEFQSRYAIGILEGLETWFRSLAGGQR
jgi:N-acetylmuramoyl-L-alanine amidase